MTRIFSKYKNLYFELLIWFTWNGVTEYSKALDSERGSFHDVFNNC